MKIVFIDDASDNLKLFDIYTKGLSHEIEFINDPEEGLKYLLDNQVDLCFLDIRMPSMDGYEVLNKYHEQVKESATKFCALTGLGDKEETAKIDSHSFFQHLTKPVLRATLLEVIEKVSDKSHDHS